MNAVFRSAKGDSYLPLIAYIFDQEVLVFISRWLISLALLVVVASPSNGEDSQADSFVYVTASDHLPSPRYRMIESDLPGGLTEDELIGIVDPEAKSSWRFGWFTYGEINSRSVGVGLRGDNEPELYVDLDRDKRFTLNERIEPSADPTHGWSVKIDAEFIAGNNDYQHVGRSILVRRPKRAGLLEIATSGVMQGTVAVGDKLMAALRIDRDANGCWFDSRDRILLDTDGDGKVDPIGGRISCDSICRIAGKRFVLQSDMRGERLAMIELSGVGKITPKLKLQLDAEIKKVSAVLVSRSGVRATIRGLEQAVECPVGDYRIESLVLQVSHQDVEYWFRFSGLQQSKHPLAVKVGKSIDAELLDRITLSSRQAVVEIPSGTALTITPLLKTANGLYLTGCKSGRGQPTLENRLLTHSTIDDRVIDNNSTGFS